MEASAVVASPRDPAGTLAGWKSLTLEGQKAVLFSASATLQVAQESRSVILFTTRSSAKILGAAGFTEQTTSRIDPKRGRSLELFQLRPGESARKYVFLDGIVRRTTWEPPENDPDCPFEQWREIETTDRKLTYADGSSLAAGERVTDSYSMIYLLRDMGLEAPSPEPREYVTLYRRHLVRIRLTAGERRSNEREVLNEATGSLDTLKLSERRIRIRPVGPGAEGFRGLMGMQGEIEAWADEPTGAIVEINGDAPGAGATQIHLKSFRR